jgi:tRNA(fMet)-specific endonuclease VapC
MMGLRYLLDTNICIYIAKHRPDSVLKRFEKLSMGEVGMSVITHGELCYGAYKSRRRQDAQKTISELASMIPVLPISVQVGERYGQIRSDLESSGRLIGNNDVWIAAHAVALGVTLVTNNAREFARVPGLDVENWVEKTDSPQVHEAKKNYRIRRVGRRTA